MAVSDRVKEYAQYSEIRQLAFRIKSAQAQKQFQSIAVLSCYPGEGKTLLCSALALSYADVSRSRVSIIDTITRPNEGSLSLYDCLGSTERRVAVVSMEDVRSGKTSLSREGATPAAGASRPVVHNPEVVSNLPPHVPPNSAEGRGPDSSLFHAMTEEGKTHGLVLIDTVCLTSKNRSNIDPFGVARQSDASILVISKKLLNSREVDKCLKIVHDPELRLIGVVGNEEYSS